MRGGGRSGGMWMYVHGTTVRLVHIDIAMYPNEKTQIAREPTETSHHRKQQHQTPSRINDTRRQFRPALNTKKMSSHGPCKTSKPLLCLPTTQPPKMAAGSKVQLTILGESALSVVLQGFWAKNTSQKVCSVGAGRRYSPLHTIGTLAFI